MKIIRSSRRTQTVFSKKRLHIEGQKNLEEKAKKSRKSEDLLMELHWIFSCKFRGSSSRRAVDLFIEDRRIFSQEYRRIFSQKIRPFTQTGRRIFPQKINRSHHRKLEYLPKEDRRKILQKIEGPFTSVKLLTQDRRRSENLLLERRRIFQQKI